MMISLIEFLGQAVCKIVDKLFVTLVVVVVSSVLLVVGLITDDTSPVDAIYKYTNINEISLFFCKQITLESLHRINLKICCQVHLSLRQTLAIRVQNR